MRKILCLITLLCSLSLYAESIDKILQRNWTEYKKVTRKSNDSKVERILSIDYSSINSSLWSKMGEGDIDRFRVAWVREDWVELYDFKKNSGPVVLRFHKIMFDCKKKENKYFYSVMVPLSDYNNITDKDRESALVSIDSNSDNVFTKTSRYTAAGRVASEICSVYKY